MVRDDETIVMGAIEFTAIGRPQQRGSKRPSHIHRRDGSLVTNAKGQPIINVKDSNDEKSRAWMDTVKSSAYAVLPNDWEPLRCALLLHAVFYFSRPNAHFGTGRNAEQLKKSAPVFHAQSPDLAKLVRCLEDALIGVVFQDDKLICQYDVRREWTTGVEFAEVRIVPLIV